MFKYLILALLLLSIASCSSMNTYKEMNCQVIDNNTFDCKNLYNFYGHPDYGLGDVIWDTLTLPFAIIYFPFYIFGDKYYRTCFNIENNGYCINTNNTIDTKLAYERALEKYKESLAEQEKQKQEAENLKNEEAKRIAEEEKKVALCIENKKQDIGNYIKDTLSTIGSYGYIKAELLKFNKGSDLFKALEDLRTFPDIIDIKNIKTKTLKILNLKNIEIYENDIESNILITKRYKKDMYIGKIDKQSFVVVIPINKKNINYADDEIANGIIYKTNTVIEANKKNLRVVILLPLLISDIKRLQSKVDEFNSLDTEFSSCETIKKWWFWRRIKQWWCWRIINNLKHIYK